MIGGQVLTVTYFESLKMGMLAVATPFASSQINMARFTAIPISTSEPA